MLMVGRVVWLVDLGLGFAASWNDQSAVAE